MRIEAPFYVPFIIADCSFIEEIYSDLNAVIMAEHNKKPFEVEGSYSYDKQLKQDITESAPNFHTNQDYSVQKLFQWFNSTIEEARNKLSMKKSCEIYDSWFHVAKKGGYHNIHSHPGVPIAGIFYLDDGGSDIGNSFINPIPGYVDHKSSPWCKQTFVSKATKGRLVLFPGWILHSAMPHQGDKLRIVLAFNTRYIN